MGHIGIALAGKGVASRIPLWMLIAASLASDLIDGLSSLAGIQNATTYQISHSLPGALGIALIVALAYAAYRQEEREIILIGAITFSHVLADLVTSRLPAWPGGPGIGLHLYRYPIADFVLEALIIIFGWLLYRTSLPETNRNSWAAWTILIVLLGFQAYFQTLPIA